MLCIGTIVTGRGDREQRRDQTGSCYPVRGQVRVQLVLAQIQLIDALAIRKSRRRECTESHCWTGLGAGAAISGVRLAVDPISASHQPREMQAPGSERTRAGDRGRTAGSLSLPPSSVRPATVERTTPFGLQPARSRRLPWRPSDRPLRTGSALRQTIAIAHEQTRGCTRSAAASRAADLRFHLRSERAARL